MTSPDLISLLVLLAVGAPLAFLVVLGTAALAQRPLSEAIIGVLVRVLFSVSVVCFAGAAMTMFSTGTLRVVISLGHWFSTPQYHFELLLLVDRLSLAFAGFTALLCAVTSAFAHSYLHRERGYNRFFVLFATFALGMMLTVLAGSIELVYGGWELVGLSSALLIAFFHERIAPLENGLRTFVIYRVCDLGLLAAAVLVHHWCGSGSFDVLFGTAEWPAGHSPLTDTQATIVGLLVAVAAAGKSAQVPLSGWLPRAMEGPTPSSAIFYGALSVHAGAFVLLRMDPILDQSFVASAAVVIMGIATSIYATIVGRVQTDIKSALAFASLTQVGIILAEVGLGLRMIALAHIIGHASLRTLQFLRAPSLLHDVHEVAHAVGGHLGHTGLHFERTVPSRPQHWLYRWALERGYLDGLLDRLVVMPFYRLFRALDALEHGWIARCKGTSGAPAPRPLPVATEDSHE